MTDVDQIDSSAVDLYQLLPAVYRIRDAEQGYPLRAFLDIIGGQVDIVKRDIDQLWDDFFIETCRDWVIPYIGDLIGNIPIHEVGQRRRADVAKTIFYRRRKGTLTMLEQLARDVTGWSAHAVAFFELLGWTQNMDHLRRRLAPQDHRRVRNASALVGTAHVRDLNAMDQVDGPFDVSSHTVDVRQIRQQEGWHNIRNVGFFLWRLQNYPLFPGRDSNDDPRMGVTPKQSAAPHDHGFHFSPLGNPTPLFHDPERKANEFQLADEKHVRGPIRPIAFYYDPADYYGPDKSFAIYRGSVASDANLIPLTDTSVDPPEQIVLCKQLDNWAQPPAGKVAVDLRLGRFTFADGEVPDEVTVYYNYGFCADIGGGPYVRRLASPIAAGVWAKTVAKSGAADYTTLTAALVDWADPLLGNQADAVITILDNATYDEAITIEPDTSRLAIRADDRRRPHLEGNITISGDHPDAALSLSGLLIEGQITCTGSLGALDLDHCTLVPGVSLDESGDPTQPGVASLNVASTNRSLVIRIDSCITGALQLPTEMPDLVVNDSIIDGGDLPAIFADQGGDQVSGPRTTLQRVTIWGRVLVKELALASEVIFVDPVIADRTQTGCVRFSYLPDEASRTPVRYRCQPDLAIEGAICARAQTRLRARIRPSFTSVDYGDPGFGQLHLNAPLEIRTGAEDGSEMGAFERLKQPQREANLKIRLEEYLPFGLQAGLIYVT